MTQQTTPIREWTENHLRSIEYAGHPGFPDRAERVHAPTRAVRALRRAAGTAGVLGFLEKRVERPVCLWLRSLFSIQDAEDLARLDLAWWPLRALRVVDRFLAARPGARVFEYGPGASTLWLSRRAGEVRYVEHDVSWKARIDRMTARVPNVRGRCVEPGDISGTPSAYTSTVGRWRGRDFCGYVREIEEAGGLFDLIVIDGRCRSRCLEAAVERLAPGGAVVFDNSGRARYREAINSCGLAPLRLRGLTAGLPYPDETTVLFRDPEDRARVVA